MAAAGRADASSPRALPPAIGSPRELDPVGRERSAGRRLMRRRAPAPLRYPEAGFHMHIQSIRLLCLLALPALAHAQGVPTFEHHVGPASYTLLGRDPALGAATTIPTVLVPLTLSFDAKKTA